MDSITAGSSRRTFQWSQTAHDLVRANKHMSGMELRGVITALEKESGNPRWACWRFARRMGIRSKRHQRPWTVPEQQRLVKLLDLHPVNEIARLLRRSQSSIFHMLYRLGANAKMGKDSFTKYSLATALHVDVQQVEDWISRGWLKSHEIFCGQTARVIIEAEDFCDFCRKHTRDVVGNRLRKERIDFVYHFAFPPSHAELLPVRDSKKERMAYDAQQREGAADSEGFGPESLDNEGDALDQIA